MTNNDAVLSLLSLIDARANGEIGGPTVDTKIAELIDRLEDEGAIVPINYITD